MISAVFLWQGSFSNASKTRRVMAEENKQELKPEKFNITKNTYPEYEGCAHAEIGDEVFWQCAKNINLVRKSDGKCVFSRNWLYPKDTLDTRPMIGIISQVKSRGWIFEIDLILTGDQ